MNGLNIIPISDGRIPHLVARSLSPVKPDARSPVDVNAWAIVPSLPNIMDFDSASDTFPITPAGSPSQRSCITTLSVFIQSDVEPSIFARDSFTFVSFDFPISSNIFSKSASRKALPANFA